MAPMTAVERHFRVRFLTEQLNEIQKELRNVEFTIPSGPANGQHLFDRIQDAHDAIGAAITSLKSVPTMDDLETSLSLSVATFRERHRCAEVGTGAAIVRFPEPA